jgi:DNA-binding NarL/FixJ family response regulator
VTDPLARARVALRQGDGAAARAALDDDPGLAAPVAERAELRAQAAYLEHDIEASCRQYTDAYNAFRACSDVGGAIRCARNLASLHIVILGEPAVGAGWLGRAQTLLGDDPAGSAEAGWVAVNRGMFEPDRATRTVRFRQALDLARAHADTSLELVALAYLGANLVHDDRIEEGMALLDEALAGATGEEVDDVKLFEEIFCQLFAACERAHDVTRADQWIRAGEALAARRNLPAVAAFCHTHYGGVLTAAGRWPEADVALSDAVRLWTEHGGLLQRPAALARLAELRVRQGRLDEARALLLGLDTEADAARPLAALRLAEGEPALAADVLERTLDGVDRSHTGAVPLLALLVEARVAQGRPEDAAAVADELVACARAYPGLAYVRAFAALAQGRVALAGGAGDARECLRQAVAGFAAAQLPMELARARRALAEAVQAAEPEVAIAEARAALTAFERLAATREAAATASLLRDLGVRPAAPARDDGVLTRREREVLDLLGRGLSNPEIAERLFISRKTVEHHVGNVLVKLGLRSRAEAAVYANRAEPGGR